MQHPAPITHAMAALHRERGTAALEALQRHGVTLAASTPMEQCLAVVDALSALEDPLKREDRREFELLASCKAPAEKLMEFLLAPTYPDQTGADTREQVAAKFYQNSAPNLNSLDQRWKAASLVGLALAGAGIGFSASVYAMGAAAALVDTSGTAQGLQEGGRIAAQIFQGVFTAALTGAGGWAGNLAAISAYRNLKEARHQALEPTLLHKLLSEDTTPSALRSQFGYSENRQALERELSLIPHPERHLLKHFSPHDLRVFLLADDTKRQEMFAAQPPSEPAQRLWRLANRQEQSKSLLDFAAAKDEVEVMLGQWKRDNGPVLASPVSMGEAIRAMRERYASPLNTPSLSAPGRP
jgi:hypothetical protein